MHWENYVCSLFLIIHSQSFQVDYGLKFLKNDVILCGKYR